MIEENKHNNTEKLFHNALANMEVQPSPALWDKVEARLDDENRKRPALWIWLVGSLLFITGAVAIGWYFYPRNQALREYFVNSGVALAQGNVAISNNTVNTLSDSAKISLQQQDDSINNTATEQAKPITSQTIVQKSSATSTPNKSSANNNAHITTVTHNALVVPKNTSTTYTSLKNTPVKKDSVTHITAINKTQTPVTTVANNKTIKPVAANEPVIAKPKSIATKNNTDTIYKDKQATLSNTTVKSTSPPVKALVTKSINTDSIANAQKVVSLAKKNDSIQVANKVIANNAQKKADSLKADSAQIAKKDSAKKDTVKKVTTSTDTSHHAALPSLFNIAIYYSPEIARNDVTSHSTTFNMQNAVPNLRYSFGAKFSLSFGKFELNAGIAYSQLHQTFGLDTISFSKNILQPLIINTSLGNLAVPVGPLMAGVSPAPWVVTIHDHYQYNETVNYINMPINARLNFGIGKFTPYVTAGINLQYAISENAVLDVIKDKGVDLNLTYSSLNVNAFNIGFSAGAGIEYNIVKRLSAYVEPNARLNTLPLSGNDKSLNYYFGCQGGIKLGL
ncbi:MAG TPA: hypothetical protein VK783_04885 [Bacteroidia bacterium]|nr:hypothetical protein [Bacteroidia bacterium]